ncbi:MAG: PepSY domain-containing protein [Halobacteriota archaeon]
MKTMKTVFYFCLVLAGTLFFQSTSNAQNGEDDAHKVAIAKQVLGQAKIDFAMALAIAQKKVQDGKPLVARAELIKDSARFGFYFLDGEKIYEVEVDVKTGKIVKFKEKKDPRNVKKFANAMKAVQGSKVSFKEAIEIGAKRIKSGKLIEVEMEFDDDLAIVELEFLVEDRITRVQINAKDATSVIVK